MKKTLVIHLLCLLFSCGAYVSETDFEQSRSGTWQRGRVRAGIYPAPKKEDVTFVETDYGDLGKTHFYSHGPIRTRLLISRYFGDEEERTRQLYLGALRENAYLYMPAWDVDMYGGSGSTKPEVDEVFFNNHSLGTLTGNNQIWQMNLFSVPMSIINFPESLGETGENHIEVLVDTANNGRDNWCTAIDWVALIIPAPRPLLLVHGWMSGAETWSKMRKMIRAMCGVPSCAIELGSQDSIENNAKRIGATLADGLKELWGVEQFTILAHSKGGLDSRWYTNRVSNDNYRDDIYQVLQIATPNRGSRMASYLFDSSDLPCYEQELLYNISFWVNLKTPGAYCLTPEYCARMDQYCPPEDAAVISKVVTGRVPDKNLKIFGVDIFPIAWRSYWHCDVSPNSWQWGDGVVSVASAHSKVYLKPASPLHGKGYDHIGIINDKALQCANVYLREITTQKLSSYSTANMYGSMPSKRGAAVRSQEEPAGLHEDEDEEPDWEPARQGAAGVIAARQQKQHQFQVQARQSLSFVFFGLEPGIQVLVKSPDGKEYRSDRAADGFQFAEIPEEEEVPMKSLLAGSASLEFFNLKSGLCTVTLNTEELPQECGYQIWLNEESSAFSLQCWLEQDTVSVGEEFKVYCRGKFQETFLDSTSFSSELQVELIGDMGVESITSSVFRDDGLAPDAVAGDCIFTAVFPCQKRGDYRFTSCATLQGPDGVQVSARAYAAGMGSSAKGQVIGCGKIEALDLNQNQMYDELQVTCMMEVRQTGKYTLSASLQDSNHEVIDTDSSPKLDLDPGQHEVILKFSGKKIFSHGVNGPYLINPMRLLEWDENGRKPALLDKVDLQAPTEPFSYFAFEHAPILLTGDGLDCGVDLDGDGVFDQLHIELDLLLAGGMQGNYQWSGTLFDEEHQVVALAHASGFLEAAQEGVPRASLIFDFPGASIAEAHRSGVYHLGGLSLWGGGLPWPAFLPVEYNTSYYATRNFVKNLLIVDVTEDISLEYGDWRVNADDGSLLSTITMRNVSGKSGQPLELVFWLVLPSSEHCRLVRVDGSTPEGKQYLDVTAQVEKALQQTGNLDQRLDPGESVQFEVALFSRDRSIPNPQLFSFWADPPKQEEGQGDDGGSPIGEKLVDDLEVLQAIEIWHQGKLSDVELLDIIQDWQKNNQGRTEP